MLPSKIRYASRRDYNSILKIALEVFSKRHVRYIRRMLPRTCILVCEVEGEVAGFLQYFSRRYNGLRISVVYYIAVAPKYRGMGIGSMLLETFEDDIWSDVDIIMASTWAENKSSMTFFEKHGYTIYPLRKLVSTLGYRETLSLVKTIEAFDDNVIMMKPTVRIAEDVSWLISKLE